MNTLIKNIKQFRPQIRMRDLNFVKKYRLHRFKKSAVVLGSILVFLILNFLFSYISLRMDLSKGQAHTLSDSTKELVQKLENPVTITLYASDNIPARLQPLQREVIDILREYERTGNTVVQISAFNSEEDQETLQTLQQAGIIGIPVREQQQNEVSITEIYFGIIVQYQEKQEVIGQALDVENLEYNVTSAIYRLTNPELPKIAVIGSEEGLIPQQDELSVFKQVAASLFDVQNVAAPIETEETEEEVPITIDPASKTLLVFDSPQREFSDQELVAIDKYTAQGNAVVFTNGVTIDDSTLETASGEAKLHALLGKRGIAVQPNFILSSRAEMVNLGGQGFSLLIPYPMWLKTDAFNNEVNLFSGVGSLTFPWASSLQTKETKGFETRQLVETSDESWEQRSSFSPNPQQIPQPQQEDIETFVLAAESFAENGAKMMVIGSSRFIHNQYLSRESQNLEFILNVLSDYASDGALSGIGRRALSIYTLPSLPKSVQEVYKYTNILLFPSILGIYGAYRLFKRNRDQ